MRLAINIAKSKNVQINACETISIAPSGRSAGMMETAYAPVIRCSAKKPGANENAVLKVRLDTLKQARKSYVRECDETDPKQRTIIAAFDREIAHLTQKLA